MKKISKFLVATFLLLSIVSNAQISKAEIVATGLTCSMCSNAINKQLKKLSDVEKVDIDLNTNTFTVFLKKGNVVSPRILKESIEKAGFFVGSMIVTMNFENQKIEDNSKIKKGNLNLIFLDPKTKTLSGITKLKVLDKGYVVLKEYKKLSKTYSKNTTYLFDNEDDYHLATI
jgi:copper chaperone CopZ